MIYVSHVHRREDGSNVAGKATIIRVDDLCDGDRVSGSIVSDDIEPIA